MNEYGRRLYFDKSTGNVIKDTGDQRVMGRRTTVSEEISTFKELSERNRVSFDYIELEYGKHTQDFAECNGYRVKLGTGELEFSYPQEGELSQEPVYQQPLTEQIAELKADNLSIMESTAEIYELNMKLQLDNEAIKNDNLSTMDALAEMYEMVMNLQS